MADIINRLPDERKECLEMELAEKLSRESNGAVDGRCRSWKAWFMYLVSRCTLVYMFCAISRHSGPVSKLYAWMVVSF